jgi:pSer/pThr/pTyr-binding forkhead associated (FHA) protein
MASLLIVGAGTVHEIPADGLAIGRDPACGIVLDSPEVSRLHARIGPEPGGLAITDESTNGVFVNGERARASHLLADGDVVRVGDVIFRFSAGPVTHAGSVVPEPAGSDAALPLPDDDDASPTTTPIPKRRRAEMPPAPLLATLDVLEGNVPHGMRFRIERPVAQLGRGAASDVCLVDDTISGAHATLMLRGKTWYLLDHSSLNGTYVDGLRVNQCALPETCELRLGGVTLRFRAVAR